jgi:hypothetical protein
VLDCSDPALARITLAPVTMVIATRRTPEAWLARQAFQTAIRAASETPLQVAQVSAKILLASRAFQASSPARLAALATRVSISWALAKEHRATRRVWAAALVCPPARQAALVMAMAWQAMVRMVAPVAGTLSPDRALSVTAAWHIRLHVIPRTGRAQLAPGLLELLGARATRAPAWVAEHHGLRLARQATLQHQRHFQGTKAPTTAAGRQEQWLSLARQAAGALQQVVIRARAATLSRLASADRAPQSNAARSPTPQGSPCRAAGSRVKPALASSSRHSIHSAALVARMHRVLARTLDHGRQVALMLNEANMAARHGPRSTRMVALLRSRASRAPRVAIIKRRQGRAGMHQVPTALVAAIQETSTPVRVGPQADERTYR